MVIKVDGLKAVIVPLVRTQKEFSDLLNWREYKNRLGLRDLKTVAGVKYVTDQPGAYLIAGIGGMQGIIVYPPAVANAEEKAS